MSVALHLGRTIRLCRTQQELKQAELAERAGISTSYLCLLERDKRDPGLAVIQRLATALQLPLGVLVFLAMDQSEFGLSADMVKGLSCLAVDLLRRAPALPEMEG
jgi:transcriptional regulator with XRE-family HTH domain